MRLKKKGLIQEMEKAIKNKGELGSSPLFNLNTQNYEKTTKTILYN